MTRLGYVLAHAGRVIIPAGARRRDRRKTRPREKRMNRSQVSHGARRWLAVILAGAALGFAFEFTPAAQAAMTRIDDKAAFLSATGATSATGPIPFLGP